MVSVVVRSGRVAERIRGLIKLGPRDDYHVDTKYDPPHLDSYYIGDEANGVMVLCEPFKQSQRICCVAFCRYQPPGILVEGIYGS